MAYDKKIKTNRSGGGKGERWSPRAEVKIAARKARRIEDRKVAAE